MPTLHHQHTDDVLNQGLPFWGTDRDSFQSCHGVAGALLGVCWMSSFLSCFGPAFEHAIRLEAIALRLEAVASLLEALGFRLEAIALRLEAVASLLEALSFRLEAIALRLEAIALRMEAIAFLDSRLEAIALRGGLTFFWVSCLGDDLWTIISPL